MGFMPGLTVTTRVPPDAGTTSPRTAGDVRAPDAEKAPQNDAPSPTRPPVSPITPTQESARLSGPAPGGYGDGLNQHHHHRQQQHTAFSSSASASSHSPTPPLSSNNNNDNNNTNISIFAQGRPTFTHSQPDQIGIQPPPPQPIAFDDNPDVLALKSAINILQLQRQRATADIQALNRAKVAALSDPGAFVADLAAGRIGMDGDPLVNGPGVGGDGSSDDDDGDDDEDGNEDEDADEDMNSENSDNDDGDDEKEEEASSSSESRHDQDGDISMSGAGAGSSTSAPNTNNNNSSSSKNNRRKIAARRKDRVSKTASKQPQDLSKTWRTLPKPQTVVRCPPINWAQYAVVGESLDKLHREQLAAPTLGVPAVVSPGGMYEFRGTATTTPGGGNIGSGSGSGYAVGDNTTGTGTADRTTTPPTVTGTEGYTNITGQQQIPGDTQGQGQGPHIARHQQPQRLIGIAAPYTPGRDKIDRGAGRKGSKR
ncbi:hypothetical protein QBC32DRAFT_348340 [Pseudoneurospora amorphoporcata]|uniref:Uncharacterized protein n=1 Tax=Pseudoneurospora amorphoporcata TaxID=241081 RepID=A0AAN6NRL8_9PEZI|nr:hypothetical protein QBC32DRAFT_348340 [Pseudoneurospora amorphoporcata]